MKRWFTHLTIAAYLGALGYGIACHTVGYNVGRNPAMYFIVWDMFCGWSAFSSRLHIIGEGESGRYYELAPGPWGEFQPFGSLGRRHYDTLGTNLGRIASNTLKHTKHEPITRVFAVEECWPKKFNLPDRLWKRRYAKPKDIKKYYQVRAVMNPQGEVLQSAPSWVGRQYNLAVSRNPRLHAEARKGKPFFAINRDGTSKPGRISAFPSNAPEAVPSSRVGSPLGN